VASWSRRLLKRKPKTDLSSLSSIVSQNAKSIEGLAALLTIINEQAASIKTLADAKNQLISSDAHAVSSLNNDPIVDLCSTYDQEKLLALDECPSLFS